jgi:hypothetical protein
MWQRKENVPSKFMRKKFQDLGLKLNFTKDQQVFGSHIKQINML